MFEVNVSPDMGMYHLLRSQGYDPAYAVAEFIDNALHAHYAHTDLVGATPPALEISLHFYSADFADQKKRNSLIIEDSGPGITKARLADAMKPAKAAPHQGLSEFGIGMKAASVWFSDKWTLSTIPDGSPHKYDLTFDLPALLDAGSDKVAVQEEERKKEENPGTTITLHQLRRPINKDRYDEICGDLIDLYQRYTEGALPRLKLDAYYNDTPATPSLKYIPNNIGVLNARPFKVVGKDVYAYGKSRAWTVPVDMVFEGVRVHGHIDLRETGSYVDNPGIVMFRGDRVIKGTTKSPNVPTALFKTSNKYARQRIYGCLFADGLPVTYTKDAFEIDENAFWDQLRAVDGIQELLDQAENLRVNKDPIVVKKEADIPTTRQKGAAASKGKDTKTAKEAAPKPTPKARPKPSPPPLVALLGELKPKTTTLALQAMIDETIYQHLQLRREIATAMCLRSVLELSVLERIKKSFGSHYSSVSELGIKKVLNYLHNHTADFFDRKQEHRVIKCVQSNASGNQIDVILLNNTAHGTFHPMERDINIFVQNLEPLLRWAFE